MTAEELAGLIGDDAAMLFMARQGGQRYCVPKKVTPRLIDHMGEKSAAIFVREFPGCFVFVPTGRAWRVKQLLKRGLSVQQVALALCMSSKQVRNIAKAENVQGHDTGMRAAA